MAITSDYKHIKNAYIRVGRIWGSKSEGWNCWVEVLSDEKSDKLEVPHFMISAPYIEGQNPFEALYSALDSHVKSDTPTEISVITEKKLKKKLK